jgi:hypothetical protein
MQFILNDVTTVKGFSSVILLKNSLQFFQVVYVIYFTVISRSYIVLMIEGFLYFSEENLFESFIDFIVSIDMVDGYASLSTVEVLAKNYPESGTVEVSSLVDDNGALPSQLENAGSQILGCLNSHQFPGLCGTGKADNVELEPSQSLADFFLPFYHSIELCVD